MGPIGRTLRSTPAPHREETIIVLPEYRTEPYSDFTDPTNGNAYEQAIRAVEASLGERGTLIIGGDKVDTKKSIESVLRKRTTKNKSQARETTDELTTLIGQPRYRFLDDSTTQ